MSLLSDLPDDILNLISIRLNGFDNCSLWIASDSILKQRLVNNVITDFDIEYTIPGRYQWPGNFLKKLKRLSRLSVILDDDVSHRPIENVELFPIPTLKYLKLDFTNFHQTFERKRLISFNDSTGPTTSSSNRYINLNDYFPNLEYFKIISTVIESGSFPIDFLRFLPQNLKTLSMAQYLELDPQNPTDELNTHVGILPRTLIKINTCFDSPSSNMPSLDLSKLPPNLTSLTTNVSFDDQTYHMIPKSLKKLQLIPRTNNIEKLSPYLPTVLESLTIDVNQITLANQPFSRLQSLKKLFLHSSEQIRLDDFLTKCPPQLEHFRCMFLVLTGVTLPNRLFSDCLTTLVLHLVGVSAEFISSLPQSLTSLTIAHSRLVKPFAFFSLLPRNLKSLHTNFDIVEKTSLLPESLTFLHWITATSGDASYFDRLPPKLETLIVKQDLPRSMLQQLPASLTSLNLTCKTLIVDDEIFAMLPRGLKELILIASDSVSDAGAADLPNCLRRLNLYKNTGMTDKAIGLLPKSLIELNLPRNPNFTDECVKHLPPKLTALHLNAVTKITSNSCKDLPRYLYALYLPNCQDWDPEMLLASKNELPQYINIIDLGNHDANKIWAQIITDRQSCP